jgi:hypothetical protein
VHGERPRVALGLAAGPVRGVGEVAEQAVGQAPRPQAQRLGGRVVQALDERLGDQLLAPPPARRARTR